MKVRDIMTNNIFILYEDATVEDAIKLMIAKNIGYLPVCNKKGQFKGTVTDRELFNNYFKENPADFISQILSKDIPHLTPEQEIHGASLILASNKVSKLPVIKDGILVGILSISDMAKHKVLLSDVANILHKKNS